MDQSAIDLIYEFQPERVFFQGILRDNPIVREWSGEILHILNERLKTFEIRRNLGEMIVPYTERAKIDKEFGEKIDKEIGISINKDKEVGLKTRKTDIVLLKRDGTTELIDYNGLVVVGGKMFEFLSEYIKHLGISSDEIKLPFSIDYDTHVVFDISGIDGLKLDEIEYNPEANDGVPLSHHVIGEIIMELNEILEYCTHTELCDNMIKTLESYGPIEVSYIAENEISTPISVEYDEDDEDDENDERTFTIRCRMMLTIDGKTETIMDFAVVKSYNNNMLFALETSAGVQAFESLSQYDYHTILKGASESIVTERKVFDICGFLMKAMQQCARKQHLKNLEKQFQYHEIPSVLSKLIRGGDIIPKYGKEITIYETMFSQAEIVNISSNIFVKSIKKIISNKEIPDRISSTIESFLSAPRYNSEILRFYIEVLMTLDTMKK